MSRDDRFARTSRGQRRFPIAFEQLISESQTQALIRHDPVYLDTASIGKLLLGATQLKLDLKQKVHRQPAEAAAVLEEEASADENTWVMNKD